MIIITHMDVPPRPRGTLAEEYVDALAAANAYVTEHARHNNPELLRAAALLTFQFILERDLGEKGRARQSIHMLLTIEGF